ncbi:Lrp/AsnC family transcriptional regulator [Streptomyces anulatus]|uniref:Lrp/AsnC family transcriptional regulator n=1 Tax=Streptomyces anulatus TaxID=1892 RepID=UPI003658B7F7
MVLSDLERTMVIALRRAPRASYSVLAAEVGADERTVRRALERLRADGVLTLSATVLYENAAGWLVAQLEIGCRPGTSDLVARALTSRDDTRFVAVTTGTADVVADLVVPDTARLHAIVTSELGALDGVQSVRTQIATKLLFTAVDWDPDGRVSESRERSAAGTSVAASNPLDETDLAIAAALADDVRVSLARVARELGVHETTVQRRLNRMVSEGGLALRADVQPAVLGFPAETRFSLSVRPSDMGSALRVLSAAPALRALYVTTGPATILGYSVHTTVGGVNDLMEGPFAEIPGLLASDISVVLHAYKRAGTPM